MNDPREMQSTPSAGTGYAFSIDKDVVRVVTDFWSPVSETGGVLSGAIAGKVAEVVKAVPPTPDTISREGSVVRGCEGLDEVFAAEEREGRYYIGEWHTHTDRNDFPSSTDVFACLQVLSRSGLPSIVLAIVAGPKAADVTFYQITADGLLIRGEKETPLNRLN